MAIVYCWCFIYCLKFDVTGYSVPRATFYALGIVTLGYLMLSVALTLMVPYNMVSVSASLTAAFAYHDVSIQSCIP